MLEAVKSIFKTKKEGAFADEAFAPSLKMLIGIKKDVLYLKDFHFKKTTGIAGDTKSAFKGRGIEFEEVRPYGFGDDARDIDWRVTARKNQPFTKLYTEQKDRQVYVFLDLSAPMYFATNNELKSVTAAKTAALLGWLTISYKDRFGLALYTGKQTYIFEARRGQDYLLSVLKKIAQEARANLYQQEITQPFAKALQLFEKKAGRQSIVFLISAFDQKQKATQEILSLIGRNEVYLVDIYDSLERNAPPVGVYNGVYEDEKVTLNIANASARQTYQKYFEDKRGDLRDMCARYGAHYRPVFNDLPVSKQLRPV